MKLNPLAWFCMVTLVGCGAKPTPQDAKPAAVHPDPTPQDTFAAYLAAIDSGNWNAAYDCLTPAARERELFGLCCEPAILYSVIWERHQDSKRAKQMEKLSPGEMTDDESRAMIVGLLKDERAFYVEASAYLAEDLRRLAPRGPLRSVRSTRNRARGLATHRVFGSHNDGPLVGTPYTQPIYFAKSGSAWLIDVPMAKEDAWDTQQPELYEHGQIEAYHHCPHCGSRQGGLYTSGEPAQSYSSPERTTCDHQWQEITREQFDELAAQR